MVIGERSSVKRPKEIVRYGKGTVAQHCSLCRHFIPPHACEGVAGHIDPGAWCIRFVRKPRKKAANA